MGRFVASFAMSPAGKRRNTGPWYSHWCVLLDFHLKRKRLTGQGFAHMVGVSQQMVHAYATGKTRPPLDLVPHWSVKLSLNAAEQHQFMEAAYEAHTPEPIWARLIALENGSVPTKSAERVQRECDRCHAELADCVGILRDVEDLFYARVIPFERMRSQRELVGVAVRQAIQRYARAPTA